ncbi:hypothetical protein DRQ36_11175, partial [bacterium]
MRYSIIFIIILTITVAVLGQDISVPLGGDYLNEAPFHKVPQGMSFEEYRDANRRISVGLMMMSVPVPGMLHFYGDEDTKGWLCVGAAGLGLTSVIIGALLSEEGDYPESDYEIITIDGNRYEKIPFMIEGEQTDYFLNRLEKQNELSTGGI